MKRQHVMTVHHKLTQAFWWNSMPQNIVMLRENVHQALHTIFGQDTPIQRLRRLIEVDKTTLHPDVYKEIDKVLARYEWAMEIQIYDPRIFNSDKFLKQWKKSSQ